MLKFSSFFSHFVPSLCKNELLLLLYLLFLEGEEVKDQDLAWKMSNEESAMIEAYRLNQNTKNII